MKDFHSEIREQYSALLQSTFDKANFDVAEEAGVSLDGFALVLFERKTWPVMVEWRIRRSRCASIPPPCNPVLPEMVELWIVVNAA